MKDAIYNVDATALFYARPKPDMGDLLLDLNARLANEDGCHLSVSSLSHDDWWLLTCEKFHIMIAFFDAPAKRTRLDTAMRSAVTTLSRFDYTQAVESHRVHLNIEIGDGSAPLPPEARVIMQEFGSATVCDPALKMKALHWTSQFIAGHEAFLALHFGPSDRLFCPVELGAAAELDMPDPLLTHPMPSLPEQGPGGVDGYALTLNNSHHLAGPRIELEGIPVKVPLATAVNLMGTLRKAVANGKLTLEHGRVLRPSEKLCLYVREELGTAEQPDSRFVLSFWADRGHDAPVLVAQPELEEETHVAPALAAEDAATPEQSGSLITSFLKRKAQQSAADLAAAPEGRLADADYSATNEEALTEGQASRAGKKRGMFGWVTTRMTRDAQLRAAGFAVILCTSLLWNPYSEFTGGISVNTTQIAETEIGIDPALDIAETKIQPDTLTVALAHIGR